MKNILYIIATMLIILWGIGLFGFNVGSIIHTLPIVAFIAVLLKVIQNKGEYKYYKYNAIRKNKSEMMMKPYKYW